MASIYHPVVGTILGNLKGNVMEFLGLTYATLADHLAPPVPIDPAKADKTDITDATDYGYVYIPTTVGILSLVLDQVLIFLVVGQVLRVLTAANLSLS